MKSLAVHASIPPGLGHGTTMAQCHCDVDWRALKDGITTVNISTPFHWYVFSIACVVLFLSIPVSALGTHTFVASALAVDTLKSEHHEYTKIDSAFKLLTVKEKAERFSLFFDRLPENPEPTVSSDVQECKTMLSKIRGSIEGLIVQPTAVYQTYGELEQNLPFNNCGPMALDRHWLRAPTGRLGEYLRGSQKVKDLYNVTAYIADKNFAFYQLKNTDNDNSVTQEERLNEILFYAENYCRRSSDKLGCPIPSSKYTQISPSRCQRVRSYGGGMRYEPSRDEALAGLDAVLHVNDNFYVLRIFTTNTLQQLENRYEHLTFNLSFEEVRTSEDSVFLHCSFRGGGLNSGQNGTDALFPK